MSESEKSILSEPPNCLRSERIQTITGIESLLDLFEDIATTEGWQHGGELRSRSALSTFFGLRVSDDSLSVDGVENAKSARNFVGGLQLVCPDEQGKLPCQKLWPEIALESAGRVAYVGVLAVRKEWRGRRGDVSTSVGAGAGVGVGAACFWMLTGALWRHCMENGITDIWLEATPTMLRCYRLLGWPLKVRGPLRPHWGEDCYICSLSLRETAGALVEKALRSKTYRAIVETALDS